MNTQENDISYSIRGAIFKVYNHLGPGLLESVYETALAYELSCEGLEVKRQVVCPVIYETIRIDAAFRLDLLVENRVIVEIKSVEALQDVHHKQLLTYLRLTQLRLGILVNFNTDEIIKSIIRKVNRLYE